MLVDNPDQKLVDFSSSAVDLSSPTTSSSPQLAGPSNLMAQNVQASAAATASQQVSTKGGFDFADSNYFVPPGGEAPPPGFTPYAAEYFESGDGSIVSHDPHLNEDGEALYRFLLSQSQIPPQLLLRVHGEHEEHRSRSVRRIDDRGHAHWHTETETITVVDFDFQIDVSQHIIAQPVQWTVPDEEATYRGGMELEVDGTLMPVHHSDLQEGLLEHGRRRRWKANSEEKKRAKLWNEERTTRGLPPWVGSQIGRSPAVGGTGNSTSLNILQPGVLRSSMIVRQWADEYCASKKLLKEFTYKKIIYGWNFAALEAAVLAATKSTYYSGRLNIQFKPRADKVYIRADNWLSRVLSRKWLVVLLWIMLIYPFIWLFKRFASGGGGRWEVCGGAYALKSWRMINPAEDDDPPPPFSEHDYSYNGRTIVNTPGGQAELVGMKEGEWFQRWEGTIKRAVLGRLQSPIPLTAPDDGPLAAAVMLDGYQPHPHSGFAPLIG